MLEEKWELGMEWEGDGKRCVGMESGEEGMGMGKRGMVGKWELDGCSDTLPMPKWQRIRSKRNAPSVLKEGS